jgi:catechol 2,3-dioxygenase-like lactoylglutathione lyase family enzyme
MRSVRIGKGKLAGKGVYANRDFKRGEVVIKYHLKPISKAQYSKLPESEKMFTHTHWGQTYLYSEPERYVNHNKANPNVYQDLFQQCDVALRDIKKGEAVTGDATKDDTAIFKKVDCVLVKVPSIRAGIDFYCKKLGHSLVWRKSDSAGLELGESELVLSTKLDPETDILVESVDEAVRQIVGAGGTVVYEPEDIPVGRAAVVADPFGNQLTLVDLSKGTYKTNETGRVTKVA